MVYQVSGSDLIAVFNIVDGLDSEFNKILQPFEVIE